MARASDMAPLPFNYRDVGLSLPLAAVMPAGRVLRCGAIDNCSWTALGRPGTIINLRKGSDSVAWPGCAILHLGAANDLEKYDTSDKAVREWVCSVLLALVTAELPVVIHCRSGRDRTGVIVAAILSVLDVPEGEIITEYALSEGADPSLLEQTLAPWRAAGGIKSWVRGVDLALLRARLTYHTHPFDRALAHHALSDIKVERDYLCARAQDLWPLARPQGKIDQGHQAQLIAAMLPVFERLTQLRPVPEAGRIYAAHGWCLEAIGSPGRAIAAYAEAEACGHLAFDDNAKVRQFVARRRRALEKEGFHHRTGVENRGC